MRREAAQRSASHPTGKGRCENEVVAALRSDNGPLGGAKAGLARRRRWARLGPARKVWKIIHGKPCGESENGATAAARAAMSRPTTLRKVPRSAGESLGKLAERRK